MRFEVRHASYGYRRERRVLSDINFSFDCRGILAILGRNGAGKTTLLKNMLGLLKWDEGASLVDGVDIRQIPERDLWSKIGYVPQAKPANFVYSVEDTVLLGRSARLGLFAHPGKADREIAQEVMALVGIEHLARKLTSEISGGEYQLVLIARALAVKPRLLVLDEPESNLDFKNQLRILKVLRHLTDTLGVGAIINTHFPAHALEVSSETLILMPDGTTRFGDTKTTLTEAALSESFGIGVRILDVQLPERPGYACVAAYEPANSRPASEKPL